MRTEESTVDVNIGSRKFSRPVSYPVYETVEDVVNDLQNPKRAKDIIEHINYSTNLNARTPIRAAILQNEGAQEMAFEKNVKEFMKARALNGKPVSEDKARELVKTLMDS